MRQWFRLHSGAATYFAVVIPLMVLIVGATAWALLWLADVDRESEALAVAAEARQEVIDQLVEDGEVTQEQLRELGEEPDAPPPEERVNGLPDLDAPPEVILREGPKGDPPSAAEIEAVARPVLGSMFDAFVAANPIPEPIPGPSGPPGEDGADATQAMVDAAVASQLAGAISAYFAANPVEDGADGQPPLSFTVALGGRDLLCERTDPFSFDAPTYTCETIRSP